MTNIIIYFNHLTINITKNSIFYLLNNISHYLKINIYIDFNKKNKQY